MIQIGVDWISTFSWQYWLHQFGHYVMLFFNSSLSYSVSYTCKGILQPISDYSNPLSSGDPAWSSQKKAALQRHSMWSVYFWVSSCSDDITNHVLRTGCVWLMENPAGFKLNTDLAGVLGMLSLNAIQIWSTLWFFMSDLFIHLIKLLALSGIIFGFTAPVAMTIDVISLSTIHISALHKLILLLYSHQIQAISSLWRLFRGKKCNPLCEYTVEQHVIVSVIHATPYNKIFLWLLKKRRFPSGMWLEIISSQCNHSQKVVSIGCIASSSKDLEGSNDNIGLI
ncbi:hypothetical protein Leryth_007355 [Lithospermum erythrorhizon]|nr:hypothetical protein Leryth_007355 [Lithospermum erythrorhizon]